MSRLSSAVTKSVVDEIFEMVQHSSANESWSERAVCVGLDSSFFFPDKQGENPKGKRVCRGCPVKDECYDFAIRNEVYWGMWGGVSEHLIQKAIWAKRKGVAA